MWKLDNLKPTPKSKRERKRVGRGDGSGHGTYAGRGGKGQTARAGFKMPPGFEGGQTPLWKRIPKRGFKNPTRRQYAYVNLDTIAEKFEDGAEVTPEKLLERGLIKEIKDGVKVLGRGSCKKALTIRAHSFSKKAIRKIEEAGGKAIVLPRPRRGRPLELGEGEGEGSAAQTATEAEAMPVKEPQAHKQSQASGEGEA